MNFSHLSGWGLLLPFSLLDQVAKLEKEAVAGPKCGGWRQVRRVGQLWYDSAAGHDSRVGWAATRAHLAHMAEGAPVSDGLAHSC